MRKIFTVFILIMICLSNSFVPVHGNNNQDNFYENTNENANRLNEYLVLKEMHKRLFDYENVSYDTTQYSKELLETVENYHENYVKHIINMNSYSDEQLKNFNYTDLQIRAIRNFDYSEEMLIAASSYVDVYGGFTSYYHSSSYSTANVVMAFNWYGNPLYWFMDIFAVTWTDFNVSSAVATIGWKPTGAGSYFSQNVTIYASGTHSDYIKFNKRYSTTHVLAGGSIIYSFYANHNATDPVVFAAYGYNTVNITPSVTFGGSTPGTLGISFSSYMITADSARVYP